jgi:nicotinamide mononucleotide adenylyltransferase
VTPTAASLLHLAAGQASPIQSRHTGAGLLTPTPPTDKQGSPWVRGILQEAAQTAKRHPMFASAYAQLAHRRGNHIATTAIARRRWPAVSTS